MGVIDVVKPNIPKPATVVMDNNSGDKSGPEAVRGVDAKIISCTWHICRVHHI